MEVLFVLSFGICWDFFESEYFGNIKYCFYFGILRWSNEIFGGRSYSFIRRFIRFFLFFER